MARGWRSVRGVGTGRNAHARSDLQQAGLPEFGPSHLNWRRGFEESGVVCELDVANDRNMATPLSLSSSGKTFLSVCNRH